MGEQLATGPILFKLQRYQGLLSYSVYMYIVYHRLQLLTLHACMQIELVA